MQVIVKPKIRSEMVPDENGVPIDVKGERRPLTNYWRRREIEGSVEIDYNPGPLPRQVELPSQQTMSERMFNEAIRHSDERQGIVESGGPTPSETTTPPAEGETDPRDTVDLPPSLGQWRAIHWQERRSIAAQIAQKSVMSADQADEAYLNEMNRRGLDVPDANLATKDDQDSSDDQDE